MEETKYRERGRGAGVGVGVGVRGRRTAIGCKWPSFLKWFVRPHCHNPGKIYFTSPPLPQSKIKVVVRDLQAVCGRQILVIGSIQTKYHGRGHCQGTCGFSEDRNCAIAWRSSRPGSFKGFNISYPKGTCGFKKGQDGKSASFTKALARVIVRA